MKTRSIFVTLTVSCLLALTACNNSAQQNTGDAQQETERTKDMHLEHQSIRDNFAHQDIIILDDPYRAGADVNRGLKEVVNAYLEMKDALINDNVAGVDKAAAKMAQKVGTVDGSSLKGEGESAWQQHFSLYSDKLTEMQHVEGLDEKRSYFSHISEIMYCTIKSFDLKKEIELYAIYCPMAFDGKGAYWIAETEEVSNPYFGSKMLKCGKVEEVL
jgi:5S rRNA maturation endonuclease (ribonuclease M5)